MKRKSALLHGKLWERIFSIDKYYSPELVCTGHLLGLTTALQGMSKKISSCLMITNLFNLLSSAFFYRYDRLF